MLRKIIHPRSKTRLMYHKIAAILAALFFRFPSTQLKVIAVTGTSGKSTTVELIHHLLQSSGKRAGAISTINFHFGDRTEPNTSLRTTLRPWTIQKYLRKMVKEGIEFCVLEVSSHAIDQHRVWGVDVDAAVLTNVTDNEHLDYHGTFADYVRTKAKLFRGLNFSFRKSGIPKMAILNRDDAHYEIFEEIPADRKWSYSIEKHVDVKAENIQLSHEGTSFVLKIPNHHVEISTRLIGQHNLENLLAAISAALAFGVSIDDIQETLRKFSGVAGRLEVIPTIQDFSVVVDFSYKPSGLEAVLKTLKDFTPGKTITVWGGAGGRSTKNRQDSAQILDRLSDEIVLTTDDPYDEDPKKIATQIQKKIERAEGDRFFEIEDRYEAIRYAIFIAEPGDTVLVAGRGHEKMQTIGPQKIPFDDREVCREVLASMETSE